MDHKIFGAYEERCVPIREIDPDRGVQMRDVGMDARKAAQYADRYREHVKMPPVVLFYDGVAYHRADGAHRIGGARMADLEAIDAHVYKGGRREALLYAAGANADFGLDRTDETIRTSILTLLRDAEWYEWSDRAIARHVTCSHTTVAKLRRQVDEERAAAAKPAPTQPGLFDAPAELVVERDPEEPRVRRGADGRKINTSKIGAGKKQEQEEQRLRELLAGARELGAQDAAKGLRSQGELVRALGGCPPGKLEVLWAAYRAALEETRAKAQAKTFQPASEATEALRGKPIGGPPLALSPSNEVEKEDPAEDETAEDEDEADVCRICGKLVCEDVDACLAAAAAEDGEDLDEDDGAEEPPRATALSVLTGLVNNLASDPARKGEVGAELLRLAGELGAVQVPAFRLPARLVDSAAADPDERVADLQMEVERLAAASQTLVQQRDEAQRRDNQARRDLQEVQHDRDRAERERDNAQERERDLLRTLFGLARTWSLQPGLEGPRAALLEVLDASPAQQVALWEQQLREAMGKAEPVAQLSAKLEAAEIERAEARDLLRRTQEDAGDCGLVICEYEEEAGEDGCNRLAPPNPDGPALCRRHQAAAALARTTVDVEGEPHRWESPSGDPGKAKLVPVAKPAKAARGKAKAPAAPPAAPRRDPATLTQADLPVSPGLRWEKRGALWFAEPVVLRQMSFLEAFAVGDPVVTGYGCSYRIDGTCGRSGLRVRDARPGMTTSKGGGQINDMIVLGPGVARQANPPGVKDPTAPIAIPIEDRFVVKVAEEQLSPILAKTLEDWGGDWGNQTAAIKELARAALAAAMDAAAAAPAPPAPAGLVVCEHDDGEGGCDRLCAPNPEGESLCPAHRAAQEEAAATPVLRPKGKGAKAAAAPGTWQPASVGGAQAVHALPVGAADGDHGHPAAPCGQRPNYKSKGWTPRPGVALTCKGCLAATGSAS